MLFQYNSTNTDAYNALTASAHGGRGSRGARRAGPGTQFTSFTSTKVPILTQKELQLEAAIREGDERVLAQARDALATTEEAAATSMLRVDRANARLRSEIEDEITRATAAAGAPPPPTPPHPHTHTHYIYIYICLYVYQRRSGCS